MTRFVGIDFGTSTSLIAVRESENVPPQIIPIGLGANSWMPSVIATTTPMMVGERATEADAKHQIRSIKSGLTRGESWFAEQAEALDSAFVRNGIASLLSEVKRRAEAIHPNLFAGARVFLGCPALWNYENRRTLADISSTLGMHVDVMGVLDEPIAAGVQWVQGTWLKSGQLVAGRTLVFDAGGGTLDVALIEVTGSQQPEVSVLAANSIAKSGDDVDTSIATYLLEKNPQFKSDPTARKLVLDASRRLKEALSDEENSTVQVGLPVGTLLKLSRTELEELIKGQVNDSMNVVTRVLVESDLRRSSDISVAEARKRIQEIAASVENVLLVGGLSQMPIFRRELQSRFPRAMVHSVVNPQLVVAEGLTYADAIVHLNMPRPPISFVVRPGLEEPEEVIYEAFHEIIDPVAAWRGDAFLKHKYDFSRFPDGDYEILCVLPDREKTVMPILIRSEGSSSVSLSVKVSHSARSDFEKMEFVMYATGEFLVKGKGKIDSYRPINWRRLNYGKDLEDLRLEVQKMDGSSWPDDGNDKSMASRK